MHKRINSFKHAWWGILWVYREHPNFRIHALFSLFAIVAGYFLGFSVTEYVVLILTILLVYIAEMLNTTVEEVTDLITVKWAKQAKIAKDVAAGMVLISAIGAVIIGMLLFIPRLYSLLITHYSLP